MSTNEAMLDLETLGKKPGCIIRSIGIVTFNRNTGEIGDKLYMNIDQASCEAIGLTAEQDTLDWWAKQAAEAQQQLLLDQVGVGYAMLCLESFLKFHNIEQIWCQGSDFDIPILKEVLDRVGVEVPWKYYNVRDTRTAYDLCNFNPKHVQRDGTYHNALDDCLHQIKLLNYALVNLSSKQND